MSRVAIERAVSVVGLGMLVVAIRISERRAGCPPSERQDLAA
jgi:hypothetical protein